MAAEQEALLKESFVFVVTIRPVLIWNLPKTETAMARMRKMAMKQRGHLNCDGSNSNLGSFRQHPQGQQYGQQQKQII